MKVDIFKTILENKTGWLVEKEFRFHPSRRWRADYCLPEFKVICEVEGGIWIKGRHTSGVGFTGDMEKYNTAASLGYTVLRTTPQKLTSSEFINTVIETVLNK